LPIDSKRTVDPEAWSELQPPVLELGWRDAAVERIAALEHDGHRCALPEVRGRRAKKGDERYACWDCPLGLVRACFEATSVPHPIGPRYAAAADALLESLVDGSLVSSELLSCVAMSQARFPEIIRSLAVLFVGQAGNGSANNIARAIRGDGLVVEFNLRGELGKWKTTYRRPVSGGGAMANLFTNPPPRLNGPLSDRCVVARLWWENHGN
jgi:hypothetical protein